MQVSTTDTSHRFKRLGSVTGLLSLLFVSSVDAALIGGVEFPQGAVSFADAVVSYDPAAGGGAVPSAANSEPSNALGIPEVAGTAVGACFGDPFACPFVSLGSGGTITLQFTDNRLTGSDDDSFDLWVFEVGSDVEDTYVEISKNGSVWYDVGKVYGSTAGIDIDAFGFTSSDLFAYVRLTDDPLEGATTGVSVGADIDAVGAISTVAAVPVPAAAWLFGSAIAGLACLSRRKAR
ncbi:MAG: PEP-CTERM sorting domain-containing protein [Pseudomonadales bacterium]|nr:PEP-CTERM sorting domain-containing protein [Halioglobus sp.]MCP5129654.1 PEP-CTERM sorting domain-containing protein [Pseudomonadales bacterium]